MTTAINLYDPQQLATVATLAQDFASSRLVPKHLQNDSASCLVGITLAAEMGVHPLVVLQNIYFVHGTAGWKAQFMIARANASGVFKRRIRWSTGGEGADLKVTARATLQDGEEVAETVSLWMAREEGWTKTKEGMVSKYDTMPELMLKYRSATQLIRLHAPEVMFGMYTTDELETLDAEPRRVVLQPEDGAVRNGPAAPKPETRSGELAAILGGDEVGSAAEDEVEPETGDGGETDDEKAARKARRDALYEQVQVGLEAIGPKGQKDALGRAGLPYNSNIGRLGVAKLKKLLDAQNEVAAEMMGDE